MEVKDLIIELLEFNQSAEVELYIDSDEMGDDFEFKLEEYQRLSGNFLTIEVYLDDYAMVDKRDYEDMKTQIENLESDLVDARNELDELRNE